MLSTLFCSTVNVESTIFTSHWKKPGR